MQTKIVYTFPFTFPDFPEILLLLSQLQKGPATQFGLAIEPIGDNTIPGASCSFFEIDLLKERVSHYQMNFPYNIAMPMQPFYDHARKVWVIAIDGLISERFVDVYEVPDEINAPWRKLFEVDRRDRDHEYQRAKGLITLWQSGDYSPLLFCELDDVGWYDQPICWAQWRSAKSDQALYHHLGESYVWLPYVHQEGCLLLTCQCIYDQMIKDPIYPKMGSGHWHFNIAAYKHDGMLVQQDMVPGVTFPVQDVEVAGHDFMRWLEVRMDVTEGPGYGSESRGTCVAALVMQDRPESYYTRRNIPLHEQRHAQPAQGGLYWLDAHGRVLGHDPGLLGEQTSMCLCGDQVIGTTLQDGQRQLWGWSPRTEARHTIFTTLSSEVQRATVIAPEKTHEEEVSWFWCVEEYPNGIRVTQRESQRLQEVQQLWCEGIGLPEWWHVPRVLEKKPRGVVAYQDTLLVLAINQEKQLQLLQFHS